MKTKGKILYFSHGGGPLPILGDASHGAMLAFLKKIAIEIKKPDLVLVISAHWEGASATLTTASRPPLFYDYYGFPKEAYEIEYPASGDPEFAAKVAELLKMNGIDVKMDDQRGFDHGVFIPLKLMYPDADIPVVQLSLVKGLDPALHLRIGQALKPLLEENILVLGSGFSYHNLRAFMRQDENELDTRNEAFQDWLIETCSGEMRQEDREKLLINWEAAPHARYCHPREEHLLPVHVCAGMGGKAGKIVFDDQIIYKRCIGVLW